MNNLTYGFIGLGLIGGSIAKGLRQIYPNCKIIAYNRGSYARETALADGTATIVTDRVDASFSECDYIFLCAPVEYNIDYLCTLKPILKPSCIITDVGSTKTDIHTAVIAQQMEENFIGGHPMAGSEKNGYDASHAHLLQKSFYVLTPTSKTDPTALKRLQQICTALGSFPVVLDYKEHDYIVAAISHLPHLIASSLVNLVEEKDSDEETMKLLAAGGFKDITRIASSSPEVWQQICMTNRQNLILLLNDYMQSLTILRDKLVQGDTSYIYDMFDKSRTYRDLMGQTTNPDEY